MEFQPKPYNERRRASLTWYTDFRRLQSDPHGALLVRLMQAANDIYLADWNAAKFDRVNEERIPKLERHLRIGANQYFMRLMSGHLNEGISLVHEFNKHPSLVTFLDHLPLICRGAHGQLCACLKGGNDFNYFRRTVGRLRDTAAFHYDPDLTKFAIDRLAD